MKVWTRASDIEHSRTDLLTKYPMLTYLKLLENDDRTSGILFLESHNTNIASPASELEHTYAAAHLRRSYPFPGSMVTIAFIQASLFCASFGRACVLSYRFILCPSTSASAFIEVSSLPPSSLFLPLKHYCRLFSMHGHTKKGVSGDWRGHCIAPEHFISDSVFPCFALNS